MKKYFKILLFTMAILFGVSKVEAQSMTINNSSYNQWIPSNSTCAGCGSIFVMVSSPVQKSGAFYYDIYLWSNSFYVNGFAANSYVKNIFVNVQGATVIALPYVVVPPKSNVFNGYFYLGFVYSGNPAETIVVNWSNISAW